MSYSLVGETCRAFLMPIRRWRSCRDYRRNHVVTPAVQTLLMEGTARNTRNRRLVPTRSMAEIQLYAVGTEEHGNVSVTSMYHSILSVNCVLRKESLCLLMKFITSCHCQKVEHMRCLTSLLYVSHVMQRFMQSVVTIKGAKNIVCTAMISNPRGGSNLKRIKVPGNGVGSCV